MPSPDAEVVAFRLQDGVDRVEEPAGQAMRLKSLEPEHRGRVRDARHTQVDPGERPIDLGVMKGVLDPHVG